MNQNKDIETFNMQNIFKCNKCERYFKKKRFLKKHKTCIHKENIEFEIFEDDRKLNR